MNDLPLQPHNSSDRLKVLDGLRAMAIILVAGHHVLYTMHNKAPQLIEGWVNSSALGLFILNGWIGVYLFFVLSGFLITGQLLPLQNIEKGNRAHFILRYFKKRFFRIAPLYYLVTAVLLVITFIRLLPESQYHPWWWVGEYLKHALFLNDYHKSNLGHVFWSLAVEFKFYLIAPVLIWWLSRYRHLQRLIIFTKIMMILLCIKVIALALSGDITDPFQYFLQHRSPFHLALDGLFVGSCCQFLWSDPYMRQILSKKMVACSLFTGGFCLFLWLTAFTKPYFIQPEQDMLSYTNLLYLPSLAIAFGMIMLGLLGKAEGYKFFETRTFKGIAIISYSFYLVHAFLVADSLHIAQSFLPSDASLLITWMAGFTVLATIVTPICVLLYYMIEKPFIDWSKKVPATVSDQETPVKAQA